MMTTGNPDDSAYIYNTYNLEVLDQKIECNIGDKVKQYEIGNIIYYPGTCYGHSQFYAKIDSVSETNMSITVLKMEILQNTAVFLNTGEKIKGLTRRPFYVLYE